MARAKSWFNILKDTFQEWNEDKCPRLAAALAYYTAFSLTPLLIVVISVSGLLFGHDAVEGRVQYQIENVVGVQAASAIQDMLTNFSHPQSSTLATVIGIVTLLLGAAGLFGSLQDALDTIWEVKPKSSGILTQVRQRFISFTMVLGICFVLLVSLVFSAAVSALGNVVAVHVPEQETILQIVNIVVSFGVITLLFAAIYKVLPDVEISWKDVWVGAGVTALLFTIGKYALGLYLGQSSVASGYGAAGSFVLLLLWIFYSAQILLFGAEFTQVYARTYGSRIVPSKNAVSLKEADRIAQGMPHTATVEAAKQVDVQQRENANNGIPERVVTVPSNEPRFGTLILGICAALATFVLGMLISTDQREIRR
ncbi:MAG TPA: YihY/virulence factor BrkB family protein [Phototrophicaceae bacterium]|nr:YihY/virulence factor BrkB family protein [Phototrophicaceae bacterium]